MTYHEMKDAVIKAAGNNDKERLNELETINTTIFEEAITDIEKEMNIKIERR